jgi:transcriptional regulator with GAF, ATPase, and Fis domain
MRCVFIPGSDIRVRREDHQVPSSVVFGGSRAILDLLQEARLVAPTDSRVLITGESGVGKEVLAHFLHERSPRSRKPMIAINCAGMPESLLESELFGHTRGSFTGAHRDRRGLLDAADGGTLLLDEVGEMSLRMQSMLLRFLESGEVQRIGGEGQHRRVDVRIIAATNRDLYELTQQKEFREDLYYRLNVVQLVVPPLRARAEDVRLLFEHFLRVMSEQYRLPACRLSEDAYCQLDAYHWPGNIRELKNIAERVAVRSPGQLLTMLPLPAVSPRAAVPRMQAAGLAAIALAQTADELYNRMTANGESFWTVVSVPFIARDLTRGVVRAIVERGLECTRGNYKLLASLFNFPPTDYKRFLKFLDKHDCHVGFQRFRSIERPPAGRHDPIARANVG